MLSLEVICAPLGGVTGWQAREEEKEGRGRERERGKAGFTRIREGNIEEGQLRLIFDKCPSGSLSLTIIAITIVSGAAVITRQR